MCSWYSWTTNRISRSHLLGLASTDVDTRSFLTYGFWPQSLVKNVEFHAIFFNSEITCENLWWTKIMFGHACNCPTPWFQVVVDCCEGYMNVVCAGDKDTQTHLVDKNIVIIQFCSNCPHSMSNWGGILLTNHQRPIVHKKTLSGLWTQCTNQFG